MQLVMPYIFNLNNNNVSDDCVAKHVELGKGWTDMGITSVVWS